RAAPVVGAHLADLEILVEPTLRPELRALAEVLRHAHSSGHFLPRSCRRLPAPSITRRRRPQPAATAGARMHAGRQATGKLHRGLTLRRAACHDFRPWREILSFRAPNAETAHG